MINGQDDVNYTLQMHKEQMEDMYKRYGGKILGSKIITINNVSFFIFKALESGDEVDLSFMTELKKNKIAMVCTLHYKKDQEAEANAIFEKIIRNVTLK